MAQEGKIGDAYSCIRRDVWIILRRERSMNITELAEPETMPSDNNAVIQDLVRDFDKNACDWCNEYKRKGLSRSSKILLNYILDEGLTGKSVLDLGSGP